MFTRANYTNILRKISSLHGARINDNYQPRHTWLEVQRFGDSVSLSRVDVNDATDSPKKFQWWQITYLIFVLTSNWNIQCER
jgi:hypothetical protein